VCDAVAVDDDRPAEMDVVDVAQRDDVPFR
jgi:hypothetical protein